MSEETLFDALRALLRAYRWSVFRLEKLPILMGVPSKPGCSAVWFVVRRRSLRPEVELVLRELEARGCSVLSVGSLTEAIEALERAGLVEPAPTPFSIAQPLPLRPAA